MCTFVFQSGVLGNMGQVNFGICEIGLYNDNNGTYMEIS